MCLYVQGWESDKRSHHCISGAMKGVSVIEGQRRLTPRRKDRLLSLILHHISSQRRCTATLICQGCAHHGITRPENLCMSPSRPTDTKKDTTIIPHQHQAMACKRSNLTKIKAPPPRTRVWFSAHFNWRDIYNPPPVKAESLHRSLKGENLFFLLLWTRLQIPH